MPKYNYKCEDGHIFTIKQRYTDPPVKICECGCECKKVIGVTSIIFRGKGFYKTDN